jgi:hypothetical protein
MVVVARQAAHSELKRNCVAGLAQSRTTRMTCGHRMVVSGHLPWGERRHFTGRMHMASLHEQHGSQGHLSPSHHDHQQRRGNGFLEHLLKIQIQVWRGGKEPAVTTITPRCDLQPIA